MFRAALLALTLILAVAACSGDDPTATPTSAPATATPTPLMTDATPTPTPAGDSGAAPAPTPTTAPPTPTPALPVVSPIGNPPEGYTTHLDAEHGFAFFYPEDWRQGAVVAGTPSVVVLSDARGDIRLSGLTFLWGEDTPLAERVAPVIEYYRDQYETGTAGQPVEVEIDGGRVIRIDIVSDDPGRRPLRLQIAKHGARTFVLSVAATPLTFEQQADTIKTVINSFVSFPRAPHGVARERSFTMPWWSPITLDPAVSHETASHFYISNLFAGLVRFGPDHQVQPDLAESYEVDESGTVYTFTLREGIAFHDGRPIAAEDFKYSIERAADPEVNSSTAKLYLGDIVGVNDMLERRTGSVDGVEVVDSRTLRITIDEPKPYFLAKMTYPTAAVVDRLTVEPAGLEWWRGDVNGSGPFKLEEWTENSALVMRRFDGFYEPAKVPYVVINLERISWYAQYRSDGLDATLIGSGTAEHALDPAYGLASELYVYPQFNVYFLGFNATKPPFDSPLARQAFVMAVDRESFLEVVYNNAVEPAVGMLPPGMPGYSDDLVGIPYDPAEARRLWDESGYGADAPAIVYTTSGSGAVPEDVQFLVDSWRENLGVEVEVELAPWEEYTYKLREQAGHMFDYGWVADYPDPENFLDALLHSERLDNNVGGYSNPEFDSLLEQARVEQFRARRLALYAEAEQLMVSDAGIMPLFHSVDYALVKPHVTGFRIPPFDAPSLRDVAVGPREE